MNKIMLILSVMICGCSNDTVQVVEGVYVREATGEFSKAADTLIIPDINVSTGSYLVIRKTGYTRLSNGIPQTKQWRQEEMNTLYDQTTDQLVDQKTGRVISFRSGELLFGTAVYRKTDVK